MKALKNQTDYNQWHDRLGSQENQAIQLAQWHQSALELARDFSGNVLEVGCGRGDFALTLSQRGVQVTAVDFSPAAIKIAQEKAFKLNSNVNFQVADAMGLPFADNIFDIVFSCECLEHVPEPQKMLSEIFRVLKPGGKVVLSTENYSNAMTLLWMKTWLTKRPFNSGAGVQPIEHYFLFWQVAGMFKKVGFQILKRTGTHHVFLITPGLHPHTFVKEKFSSPFWAWLFKPLARHVTFLAQKPAG